MRPPAGPDAADPGCSGLPNCTSVYAHSDSTLYQIDLATNALQTIGAFQAPMVGTPPKPDPITDLAVAPDGTLWVISETALYTASATDGHVTPKGSLSACGARGVASLAFDATRTKLLVNVLNDDLQLFDCHHHRMAAALAWS